MVKPFFHIFGGQFFKKSSGYIIHGAHIQVKYLLKSLGVWHMKKEHINIFPDVISAVSVT